ncbi:MAG: EAL domain-containing protein [Burkholderiales bacterium]
MARILIVDDRPDNREFLVTLLGYQQHELFEARDGAEALEVARAERPDLVVTDILMPTMDGYEFVRQLRSDPSIATTRVMFYTAHFHKHEAVNLARSCGVEHMLTKPCEPEVILRVVGEALKAPRKKRSPPPRDFDHAHLRVVTDKLSATADELKIANERLAALIEINLQLASERDPQHMVESVCAAARDLIGARYAVLAVGKGRRQGTDHCATAGMDAETTGQLERPSLNAGVTGITYTQRKSQRLSGPQADARSLGLPSNHPPVHALVVAPIVSLAHVYGWICLTDKVGAVEFSTEDERLLSILAAQVGRVYENGSLFSELRQQAKRLELEVAERSQAEESLQASETRFRQMAENIREVFWLTDRAKNQVLYVSPAYEEIWGRSCESVYASPRDWIDAIHPEDRERVRQAVQSSQTSGKYVEEFRIVRPDGAIRWVRDRAFPVFHNDSEVYRIAGLAEDITERKRASDELRESERRFSDLLRNVELVSLMLDREARITYCNEYLLRLTGWRHEEVIGRNWFELFIPPELDQLKDRFAALLANLPEVRHHENEILTRSGERRLIRWNNSVLRSAAGDVIGTASIGEDITERKRAEDRIVQLNRVHAILSGINTLIVRVRDRDQLFTEACEIAVDKGGFRMAWIGIVDPSVGHLVPVASAGVDEALLTAIKVRYVSSDNIPLGNTIAARAMRAKNAVVSNDLQTNPEVRLRKEYVECGIRSRAVLPLIVSDEAVGVLALYAGEIEFFHEEELKLLTELAGDIAFAIDHLEKEEKLYYLAYYDVLTGLANRNLFLERVAQYVRSAVSSGHKLALFLIDLERFKNINDSLCQAAGDALLRQVAEWLKRTVGDANLLARVGADHFAVVMPEVKQESELARLVEKSLQAFLEHPFRLNGSIFRVAGKVGVALFPDDGTDADTLFKNAEAALKKAKASGDRYLFYTQEMTKTVASKLTLENQLRQALDNEEFVLHYQPKVSLASGKVTSAEALIRWNDPRTGLVPPGRFIPVLEETGLIYDVGRWALRKAVEDYLRWRTAGLAPVRIAVNVSPLQLRHRGFVAEIKEAVGIEAHAAAGVELEITESMIMEDVRHSIGALQAIREIGVTIAIDDFGTGFSSLGYLSKLPVDTLKIDRGFVIEMTATPQGLALVSTIITLAHALKLNVVAEGVETEEQSRLLRLLNCDEMQGFLFSKPVPGEVFESKYLSPPPLPES